MWRLILRAKLRIGVTFAPLVFAFLAPHHQKGIITQGRFTAKDNAWRVQHLLQRSSKNSIATDHGVNLFIDDDWRLLISTKDEEIPLLAGLSPKIWSATRPSGRSDLSNSLFLHTNHSKKKPEHETSLGRLASCRRLLACSRTTRYWMGPSFGTRGKDVPLDTQFLLIEVSDGGPYALLLPLLNDYFRASLQKGQGEDDLVCHEESGDENVASSGMQAVFVSAGDDPFKLLKDGVALVAQETGSFRTLEEKKLPACVDEFGWCTWDAFYSDVTPDGVIDGVASLRAAGVQPRNVILDDGWQQVIPVKSSVADDEVATGDSNGRTDANILSIAISRMVGILSAWLKAFYEVFVKNASHDSVPNKIWRFLTSTILKAQMWEYFDKDTDFGRQLSGFLPNQKFQKSNDGIGWSLGELVSRLKNHLGVKRVYCWHALNGYWRGVSPELGGKAGINATNIIPRPSRHLLRLEPQLAWDTVSLFGVGLLTEKDCLSKFYGYLHEPLIQAGVDGVKVDVQSGVPAVGGGVGGGPHIARLYSEGFENSVSERFFSDDAPNCINCMCHSTENLYRYKVTSIARASDDFYPRRPSSHSVHLVNVAYNSLLIGEICLPDWDMFHSKHESAGLHAAARAVGGCPVYVSDAPGQHDASLLRRLILPNGTVLRAKLPGRPTRDCLFADVGKDGSSILKVWNQNQNSGVVGAFHVQGVAWNFETHENEVIVEYPSALTATVRPHDVETLRHESGPFAVWSHRSSLLTVLPDGHSNVQTELNHRDWEVFTVTPIRIGESGISWCPIGLADMFNTGGALTMVGAIKTTELSDLPTAKTTLAKFSTRGPGRFVAYCQPKPTKVLICGTSPENVSFEYQAQSGLLSFTLPNEVDGPHDIEVVWGR